MLFHLATFVASVNERMSDVSKQLEEVFSQVKRLGKLYQNVLEENEMLSQKLSLAQNSEAQYAHKLKLMEAELNSLKVAQSMVSSKEEVQLAKAKIGTLVREIDRCIAMLNE